MKIQTETLNCALRILRIAQASGAVVDWPSEFPGLVQILAEESPLCLHKEGSEARALSFVLQSHGLVFNPDCGLCEAEGWPLDPESVEPNLRCVGQLLEAVWCAV